MKLLSTLPNFAESRTKLSHQLRFALFFFYIYNLFVQLLRNNNNVLALNLINDQKEI